MGTIFRLRSYIRVGLFIGFAGPPALPYVTDSLILSHLLILVLNMLILKWISIILICGLSIDFTSLYSIFILAFDKASLYSENQNYGNGDFLQQNNIIPAVLCTTISLIAV